MNLDIQVINVWFTETKVFFDYADGRTVGAPLDWFPRLKNANNSQKNKWRLIAGGYGVHWEEIDEDLSAEGMLNLKKLLVLYDFTCKVAKFRIKAYGFRRSLYRIIANSGSLCLG